MGTLSQRAIERISYPAFDGGLREKFMSLCGILLAVSPDAFGELTTIYVKFCRNASLGAPVYGVVWLKHSKNWVVGLALPETIDHPILGPAPPHRNYAGLTKFFTITPKDPLPNDLANWAKIAHNQIASH